MNIFLGSKLLRDRAVWESLNGCLTVCHFIFNYVVDKLPDVEVLFISALDTIFIPKQILRQLLVAMGMQGGLICLQAFGTLVGHLIDAMSEKGRKKRKIQIFMNKASSFAEWQHHAQTLDKILGLDKWRLEEQSSYYDVKVLKKRTNDIKTMMKNNDVFNLIFRLRGGLARDQYGMRHEALYSRATAGTKLVVEEYNDTVAAALNFICDEQDPKEDVRTYAYIICNAEMYLQLFVICFLPSYPNLL